MKQDPCHTYYEKTTLTHKYIQKLINQVSVITVSTPSINQRCLFFRTRYDPKKKPTPKGTGCRTIKHTMRKLIQS